MYSHGFVSATLIVDYTFVNLQKPYERAEELFKKSLDKAISEIYSALSGQRIHQNGGTIAASLPLSLSLSLSETKPFPP